MSNISRVMESIIVSICNCQVYWAMWFLLPCLKKFMLKNIVSTLLGLNPCPPRFIRIQFNSWVFQYSYYKRMDRALLNTRTNLDTDVDFPDCRSLILWGIELRVDNYHFILTIIRSLSKGISFLEFWCELSFVSLGVLTYY